MYLQHQLNLIMGAKLNSLLIVLFFFVNTLSSQKDANYADYKNQKEYQKYYKTRKAVAACQIEKLSKGALVVVLKDNKLLINSLVNRNNLELAQTKFLEQYVINKNILFAFKKNYTFSNVYFIYSSSIDSLTKGVKTNIFLDTTLTVNNQIQMNENFYFLCFRDFVYSSSIGFVKEDSAKYVTENGNSGGTEYFVIKNKYGHQLKKPFPFYNEGVKNMYAGIKGKIFELQTNFENNLNIEQTHYSINPNYLNELKEIKEGKRKPFKFINNNKYRSVKISKEYLYEVLLLQLDNFNENLKNFQNETQNYNTKDHSKEFDIYCY